MADKTFAVRTIRNGFIVEEQPYLAGSFYTGGFTLDEAVQHARRTFPYAETAFHIPAADTTWESATISFPRLKAHWTPTFNDLARLANPNDLPFE